MGRRRTRTNSPNHSGAQALLLISQIGLYDVSASHEGLAHVHHRYANIETSVPEVAARPFLRC